MLLLLVVGGGRHSANVIGNAFGSSYQPLERIASLMNEVYRNSEFPFNLRSSLEVTPSRLRHAPSEESNL